MAAAAGRARGRLRDARLGELAARASAEERDLLQRIIYGEMRMGLSEGLVLEAIAEAAGVAPAAVRRAALLTGDLTTVAALALGQGAEALAAAAPRVFVPLLPMLAEIAGDVDEALAPTAAPPRSSTSTTARASSSTATATAWRSGAARISDVTRSLPDIVAIARRDLGGAPFILDGEVVALDAAGRPLPFQELMRRFRRVRGVEAAARGAAAHAASLRLPDGRRPLADGRALRGALGGARAR